MLHATSVPGHNVAVLINDLSLDDTVIPATPSLHWSVLFQGQEVTNQGTLEQSELDDTGDADSMSWRVDLPRQLHVPAAIGEKAHDLIANLKFCHVCVR